MTLSKRALPYSTQKVLSSLCAVAVAFSSGCSIPGGSSPSKSDSWLPVGSLSVSRPIPRSSASGVSTEPILGFMPNKLSEDSVRLRIDIGAGTATRVRRGVTGETVTGVHLNGVTPGQYRIVLKQRAPMWYATNEYFSRRLLPIPAEGSTERFRRGALGGSALFLDDQTPIFAGPGDEPSIREQLALDGLRGIVVPGTALQDLFLNLNVGDTVEIR